MGTRFGRQCDRAFDAAAGYIDSRLALRASNNSSAENPSVLEINVEHAARTRRIAPSDWNIDGLA
jgi:hypothetical protein